MLLSNEWIENSIETYIYQHTTKSQIIYWIVLAAVTAVLDKGVEIIRLAEEERRKYEDE